MRNTKSNRIVQMGAASLSLLLTAGASHAWWGGGPWNGYGYGPGYGVPYYGYPFNGYGLPPMPYGYAPTLPSPPVQGADPAMGPGDSPGQGASSNCDEMVGETEKNACREAEENAPARSSKSAPAQPSRYFCRTLNGIRHCWRY
jgi:hypothetical protein